MKKSCRVAALVLVPLFFPHAALDVDAAFDFADPCCYLGDSFRSDADYQKQDALYQALLQACETVDNSSGDYAGTPVVCPWENGMTYDTDLIVEVAYIFIYEHPEYFWLGRGVAHSSDGVSLSVLEHFQNGQVRQVAREQIAQEVQIYLDDAQRFNTAYEKAQYFHDALVQKVDYRNGDNDQSIASVFLEKQTVCAGYSAAYNLLCNAAGIDTVTIVGLEHAWNAVKLDNCWFLADVTFDEDAGDNTYFFLSFDEMRELDKLYGKNYTASYTDENGEKVTVQMYEHDPEITFYLTTLELLPECPMTYAEYLESLEPDPPLNAGDVNRDGSINAVDASFILAECALRGNGGPGTFTDEQLEWGDYNGDGELNAADASGILYYAAAQGNQ